MEFGYLKPVNLWTACMNRPPDRDKLIMKLCDQLVGLGTQERKTFLDAKCANDLKLRRDIEELLESIENSGEFLCLDDGETEL